jgi:hypothetical protein
MAAVISEKDSTEDRRDSILLPAFLQGGKGDGPNGVSCHQGHMGQL